MKNETVTILNPDDIKNIKPGNVRFDSALKSHMDKLDRIIKGLTAEMEAVKATAKTVFGEDGGNDVFQTKTTTRFLLNEAELVELIGAEKVKALKNRPSKTTRVIW